MMVTGLVLEDPKENKIDCFAKRVGEEGKRGIQKCRYILSRSQQPTY